MEDQSQQRARRRLRGVLFAGGSVATLAGLHTVTTGARSIVGEPRADPAIESELRFYAAFYVAYGLLLLRTAPTADRDAGALRRAAGAMFLGGLARAGGWRAAGRPNAVQRLLLVLEVGGPPTIVGWQARLNARPATA
jgi:hypothetical protein